MSFDSPNLRGRTRYIYDLAMRCMMHAAQNFTSARELDENIMLILAECEDLHLEFTVIKLGSGQIGKVTVTEEHGIVLDVEINLLDMTDPAIIRTFERGVWEGKIPIPPNWVNIRGPH